MSEFTYEFPDSEAFLYTLREYLSAEGHEQIALNLGNAKCEFETSGSFSYVRWNSYAAVIRIQIPLEKFREIGANEKEFILKAARAIFPLDAGYELGDLELSVFLVRPPDEDTPLGNTAVTGSEGTILHDGLRFRSKTETRVYDALKLRNALFFANATAVLGGKNVKREPDFLVCQNGKWGILEVMGDQYHPSATAMKDHDRARLFKDYGLTLIEFYDATRCYKDPNGVVDDFLTRLNRA